MRDVELVIAACVALLLLAGVGLQLRRTLLFRRGATVSCALRPNAGRSWQGGLARFDPDALRTYRTLGLGLRPYVELRRADLALGDRRAPSEHDRRRLMHDPVVLSVIAGTSELELALDRAAVPGLMAWVEGRPIG